jgi:hypothetical protein
MGFFVLNLGAFGALKTGQKRLRFESWGVGKHDLKIGTAFRQDMERETGPGPPVELAD